MLRFFVKMSPDNNKNWTCCFGLHVRTATMIIAMWHLLLNMTLLCLLLVIVQNPEMFQRLDDEFETQPEPDTPPALPTPLSKIDPTNTYIARHRFYTSDMGGLACMCMIIITLMMIFGIIRNRPQALLPFFCIQLFDFSITTLTAAGYVCYLRSFHRMVSESPRMPMRDLMLSLSPNALSVIVLFVFIGTVLLKAYVIGIVWRCYKFLAMRQHNMHSMLPYIIPDISPRQERDYNTLLPGYEEAIAQSMKQPPPPSYSVAMASASALSPVNPIGAAAATTQAEPVEPVPAIGGVTVILPPAHLDAPIASGSSSLNITVHGQHSMHT